MEKLIDLIRQFDRDALTLVPLGNLVNTRFQIELLKCKTGTLLGVPFSSSLCSL